MWGVSGLATHFRCMQFLTWHLIPLPIVVADCLHRNATSENATHERWNFLYGNLFSMCICAFTLLVCIRCCRSLRPLRLSIPTASEDVDASTTCAGPPRDDSDPDGHSERARSSRSTAECRHRRGTREDDDARDAGETPAEYGERAGLRAHVEEIVAGGAGALHQPTAGEQGRGVLIRYTSQHNITSQDFRWRWRGRCYQQLSSRRTPSRA